jgi:hypothetical protein
VPEGNQAQSHAPEAGPRPAAANGRADTAQPTPQSDPGPQIATPATAAQNHHPGEVGHTATTELTGSGDAVIEVTRTNWLPAVVHISGNSASEYFAVRTLGTNNVLVMTMEPYDGIRPLDWGGDESTGFEIWATGPWRIEILPPSAIPTFTGTFNGNGNMVVHFTGTGSLVRDHRKQSTPTLRSSGPQRLRPIPPPRRHNTTYAGECQISRGPQIFEVQAIGPWTITIKITHEFPAGRASYRPLHLAWPRAIEHDNEIASPAVFDDTETAVRAFTAAEPTDSPSSTPVSPDRRPRLAE